MKKFIYLSIALVTLSLTSCRNQDDMSQITEVNPAKAAAANSSSNDNASTYSQFDSSSIAQGDPAHPPRD